ncbi:MAG: hypothetical protein ACREML_10195 [Vulcanimicrobiaceae bacterium]
MPGALFAFLFAWPFIERLFTSDKSEHELLQFPWQSPGRVAVGAWLVTYMVLLLGAGSDDVQARLGQMDIQAIAWAYRIAVVILPFVAAIIAWFVCRELQQRHAEPKPNRVLLIRSPEGGFEEESIPTP